MTDPSAKELSQFLVEAKRSTYASQKGKTASSRLESKDLAFRKGRYFYLDSYFGERDFSGQEVVYCDDAPIWSMNYYGRMLQDDVPPGFIETLRGALMRVEVPQPFRGCSSYSEGGYSYTCVSEGTVLAFLGHELITYEKQKVYQLHFHGGQIR